MPTDVTGVTDVTNRDISMRVAAQRARQAGSAAPVAAVTAATLTRTKVFRKVGVGDWQGVSN